MQLNLSVNLVLCLLFSFTSCDIRVKAENYLKINKKVNKNFYLLFCNLKLQHNKLILTLISYVYFFSY